MMYNMCRSGHTCSVAFMIHKGEDRVGLILVQNLINHGPTYEAKAAYLSFNSYPK